MKPSEWIIYRELDSLTEVHVRLQNIEYIEIFENHNTIHFISGKTLDVRATDETPSN